MSLLMLSGAARAQESLQECRVRVANDWIVIGSMSLTGCLKFAREAATPGQWQEAALGGASLRVMGNQQLESLDGGTTWSPIEHALSPTIGSLNSLESSPNTGSPSSPAAPAVMSQASADAQPVPPASAPGITEPAEPAGRDIAQAPARSREPEVAIDPVPSLSADEVIPPTHLPGDAAGSSYRERLRMAQRANPDQR